MKWFYTTKGDGAQHGSADDAGLIKMADKGDLRASDLVWSEETGNRWVPASEVDGLFPEHAEATAQDSVVEAGPASADRELNLKQSGSRAIRLFAAFAIIVASAIALIAAGLWRMDKLNRGQKARRGQRVNVAQHKRAALVAERHERSLKLAQQMETELTNEQIDQAQLSFTKLKESDDVGSITTAMGLRLKNVKDAIQRRQQLENTLTDGTMDYRAAIALVDIHKKRGSTPSLLARAELLLTDPGSTPARTTLSVARLAFALERDVMVRSALARFSDVAPFVGAAAPYLQASTLYSAVADPTNAAVVLEKYVANVHTNAAAWLELAALRSEISRYKDSLKALEKATRYGGNSAKNDAAADPRFHALKEDWPRTFRRLTRLNSD